MAMGASHASAISKVSTTITDLKTLRDFLLEKSIIFPLSSMSAIRIRYPTCEDSLLFRVKEPYEKTRI